ncbi:hypothetical protein [Streptomyces capitiformicae]|uniref:Uncharacterized protein n=1 Tax=Streptomyces capitiformicae TaxID=2014920 RepID=A0A918ZCH6_9ACTN|nr:hypothetical protein [Streptomyces capitiformicae]GHE45627.1 hypothetical protein GCM10017771_66130 [Streptomyces capitiformicae]
MTIRTSTRRATILAVFGSLFLGSLAGTGVAAPSQSGTAQEAVAAKAKVSACKGTFKHAVSNVKFARLPNGRLTWSFKLTAGARKNLGSLVRVSMPQAFVSGYEINPPYGPHTRASNYDFHSSIKGYQRKGKKWKGRNFTIKTNDEISFFWLIKSISYPKKGAYRTITCKVPSV